MLFKRKSSEPPKGRDAARREIYEIIDRHGLGKRAAADMLEGMADLYRMQIATTSGLNLVPEMHTPKLPPRPKAALTALASLIAGKAA